MTESTAANIVNPIAPIVPTTKRCAHCGKVKPLSEFHKATKGALGVQSYCKDCAIAHNKEIRKKLKIGGGKVLAYPASKNVPKYNDVETPNDVIAEIRRRIAFLRENGFTFKGSLEFTHTIEL